MRYVKMRVGKRSENKTINEHLFVWQQLHGDLPKGYVVHHIDGNERNNLPENLVAMTRREHRRIHGGAWRFDLSAERGYAVVRLTERRCSYCHEWKEPTDFHRHSQKGAQSRCKKCCNK